MSLPQPLKFVLVGTAGYVLNLGVFAALLQLGVQYVADSIASYFVSNAFMYLGNRYFTFGLDHAGFWSAYLRYIVVGIVVAGLNAAVLAVLVELFDLRPTPAQAISLLLITPVAFVLNKRWTFRVGAVTAAPARPF